jgi:hypothetical protein
MGIRGAERFLTSSRKITLDATNPSYYLRCMGALKAYKCSKGHVMKEGNLYLRKDGTRECRKCSLARRKAWRKP